MAFPPRLLNDNETVALDLRPHWSTIAKPVALVIVVLAATLASVAIGISYLPYGLAVVLLVTAVWAGIRVARRQMTNFVVTDERLIYRYGLVAKHGKEIPLNRVQNISFNQSVFERLIGTGDLTIESAGAQSNETFGDIPRPSDVQNEIYRQIDGAERRQAPGAAAAPLSSVEQLDKLDQLRQRGVITQAEFDAKKQQLLDRM